MWDLESEETRLPKEGAERSNDTDLDHDVRRDVAAIGRVEVAG